MAVVGDLGGTGRGLRVERAEALIDGGHERVHRQFLAIVRSHCGCIRCLQDHDRAGGSDRRPNPRRQARTRLFVTHT